MPVNVDLPVEWFLLFLRILFIALVYFFLFQLVRVQTRELSTLALSGSGAEPGRLGQLSVIEPGESDLYPGMSFPLKPRTIVGRLHECTIALNEPFVSSEHAELTYRDGQWLLTDLSSTNGTFVNGHQLTGTTSIRGGDIVQFGRVSLQLVR